MGLSAFLSTQVIDTTSVGRSVMTASDAAAARLAIGAGTSSFDGAFSSLSGKPTTLSGYGITDAQPLDSDLTAIAALTTTAFGRSVLTQADAAAVRTLIGAGTSSFDGAYSSLSGIPSTFAPSSHTHATADITGFAEAVDDEVASLLVQGSGITLTYNDAANTLTIAASGGGGGSPGGSSGQVQFNNAGAFGGAAAAVYSATGQHLVVTAQSATIVPIRAKGAALHSGNLLEVVNSADSLLFYVMSSGAIVSANNLTVATQITANDTAWRRISAGVWEANNGTVGQRRDVELRNLGVNGSMSLGGGVGVVFIANATTVPSSNPTGGGILYVEGGALKYRGSSGTVTTLGPA